MIRKAIIAAALLIGMPSIAQESVDGLAIWNKIYEVVSHPRCSNCHVGDDNRPRWSGESYGLEEGEWTYHGMNIHAGVDRIGAMTIPCSTCHQQENSDVLHGPPGAHVWALAPVEMEWFGKSSAYICRQLKDPIRNGGRSLSEVASHIEDDELVHWGWEPGPGREPAPYSRGEMVEFIGAWAAAGAPCPDLEGQIEAYLEDTSEGAE